MTTDSTGLEAWTIAACAAGTASASDEGGDSAGPGEAVPPTYRAVTRSSSTATGWSAPLITT